MSKPIVVIVCMVRSSESWEPQQRPHPWHRCAGGGAVHSIKLGHHAASFDYPVGPGHDGLWNTHAERRRCFEIQSKFKHDRLLDGKFCRISSLEYLVGVLRCLLGHQRDTGAVACKATQIDISAELINCRYLRLCRQRNDGWPDWVSKDKESIALFLRHSVKGLL